MRKGILELNHAHGVLLSNDLGAAAGLMFDVGSGRYPAPLLAEDDDAPWAWCADLVTVREKSSAAGHVATAFWATAAWRPYRRTSPLVPAPTPCA